jgi:hypothetical protein
VASHRLERHLPSVTGSGALYGQVVAAALARGWLPSDVDRLVVACTLHHLRSGGQAASTVAALVEPLRVAYPTAQITLVVCGVRADSGVDPRQGYDLAGWAENLDVVNVSGAPIWKLRVPQLTLPIRVSALAFTRHTLITLASLSTDPYDGLSGALAAHMALFPDLLSPELWPFRFQGVNLALKLWPADLCILDAQQVVIYTETRASRMTDVHPLGCLLAGRDPSAVDRRAAALLGLSEQQVKLLGGTSRRIRMQEDEVIEVGHALPLPSPPLASPYLRPQRMKEGVSRFGYRLQKRSDGLVDGLGIARIVDFVRRCREVPR